VDFLKMAALRGVASAGAAQLVCFSFETSRRMAEISGSFSQ
jgi:hypothetical protein